MFIPAPDVQTMALKSEGFAGVALTRIRLARVIKGILIVILLNVPVDRPDQLTDPIE